MDDPIGQLDGLKVLFFSGLGDLLPVFVCSGKKMDISSAGSVIAGQDVRGYGGVGVAYVGNIVDVINRGGDLECFSHDGTPDVPARIRPAGRHAPGTVDTKPSAPGTARITAFVAATLPWSAGGTLRIRS